MFNPVSVSGSAALYFGHSVQRIERSTGLLTGLRCREITSVTVRAPRASCSGKPAVRKDEWDSAEYLEPCS